MTLVNHLRATTEEWRNTAARLREKWKGMGEASNAGLSAATALESCAQEVENALAAVTVKAPTPRQEDGA